MFTGIITNLGRLTKKNKNIFTFGTNQAFCKKIDKGTSIAVNGACLTSLDKPLKDSFSVEIMPETLNKTMLGEIKINDLVNLELPITPQSFLSGHIVTGHIDEVTKLKEITVESNSHILKFSIPAHLSQYITDKGSITINGISLTVIRASKNYFTVGIIPYTWNNTMLKTIKADDLVNVEVDILAKYLERLLKK